MMFEEGEYYSPSDQMFSCMNSNSKTMKKKMMMMNKRRFSDEQVRSMESIFENETKLEPKKKVQLARELGLQPRQVAIWFQNKRARYKSKQLELDYNVLRSSYNALASQFESLRKEKEALLLQVQKLRDLAVGKPEEATTRNNEDASNSSGINTKSEESEINTNKRDQSEDNYHHEVKPDLSIEAGGSEYGTSIILDEGSSENNNYNFETDEMEILKMVEPPVVVDDEGNWDDIDNCQWWDFWT